MKLWLVRDTAAVLAEIDDVFARCGASPEHPYAPNRGTHARSARLQRGIEEPSPRSETAMVTSVLAAIERNAPRQSYVANAYAIARTPAGGLAYTSVVVDRLLGVLLSVRQDIEAGYLRNLESHARDELSGDLLETAEAIVRLHAAPAIVLAVSVLEEHVRKLAAVNGVATTKADGKHRSFEDMIADLQGEGAISSTEKRTASAWYAQRTESAHGRFENVIADEAPRIVAGVRDFLTRHPT